MSFQTDVKAVTTATSPSTPIGYRTRVKGIYAVCGASAGSVSLKDGGASGTELLVMATPALATGTISVTFPENGILFSSSVYVTLTNVTSITLFHG